MFGAGQYGDGGDEERLQEELGLTDAARLRLMRQGYSSVQDRIRAADSATYMSLLGGNDAVDSAASRQAHALAAGSPFYQRQQQQQQQQQSSPYHRNYLQQAQHGAYGLSPADTSGIGQFRRSGGFGFPQGNAGATPEQRYHQQYGMGQPSPAQRDFGAALYGQGRQNQDLAQAALLERQYAMQRLQDDDDLATNNRSVQMSSASHSSPVQKPKVVNSASKVMSSPRLMSSPRSMSGGRDGRGGRGPSITVPRSSGGNRGGRGTPKIPGVQKPGKEIPVSPGGTREKWYAGCVSLGLPEDKYWLSELQVYLRANFAEAFGATESDIAAPMHGRNKPIALGQVGIRCVHCKHDPPSERGQQATSYPSLISGIYNSVQQMLRLHFDCCLAMPADVRQKIESLKVSSSARGGRKQYWIDSAKRLGLVDTPHGIHFGRDPYLPPSPLAGPSAAKKSKEKEKKPPVPEASPTNDGISDEEPIPNDDEQEEEEEPAGEGDDDDGGGDDDDDTKSPPFPPFPPLPKEDTYPLVIPDDKPLISDYLYLTLEQMQPCDLMEADKVGCYKGRKVGFPGLACKHCVGQAGCGRYFPASEASLSQTTTSQTIMNHVRNCRRCPIEIRENLELMKRSRMGPDGKRSDKPKHGGRKVFFHRLWCRIQRIPMDEEGASGKKKGSGTWSRKKSSKKKKRHSTSSQSESDTDSSDIEKHDLDDMDNDGMHYEDTSSEEETETEEEEDGSGNSDNNHSDDEVSGQSPKFKSKHSSSGKKKRAKSWYEGCVRLTKPDDAHWLSEMECFARSDLVEVFSLTHAEDLEGLGGRKEPTVGQVGVRCAFCKSLEKDEKPNGCMYFPDAVASVHSKINDLIRLHFPSCPAMPEDVKDSFKSLRGFGSKATGDSQQYWIDSARDIGIGDVPPTAAGWGITFRRDPLTPSPADELDKENVKAAPTSFSKTDLVRPDDRGICTDHATLLLRQVKPCRFKKNDRRGGPGARGRDRVIGFPGLCCKHCMTKSNFGRYFPVSSKNLTDNTANSLQAHVASCTRCPESIKASLAYLTHRSALQKAELSGSWKKTFFKRVWDRLHVERAWSTEYENNHDDDSGTSSLEDNNDEIGSKNGSGGNDSDEELGEDMTELIKAAAVWLSEQEENSGSASGARARGRGLPAKRPLPFSPNAKGKSRGSLPSRRRVHF